MGLRNKQGHMIDFIFPIILFFVFAISALTVILLAANVYKETTNSSMLNYTARTSLSYISEKVHQNNEKDMVYTGAYGECPALILEQDVNGTPYCTYIYEYEGQIREVFAAKDVAPFPQSGNAIIEVSDFTITPVNDQLIKVSCTDAQGVTSSTVVSVQ